MESGVKFSVEVIRTRRINLKDSLKDLLTFGIFNLWQMIEDYGTYYIKSNDLHHLYVVCYKKGQEFSREPMAISFEDFKPYLSKRKYVDDQFVYRFILKTIRYF